MPLRDQHIDLPQLRDDLFGLVALLWHRGPPVCQKTYFRMDQFNGGDHSAISPACRALASLAPPRWRGCRLTDYVSATFLIDLTNITFGPKPSLSMTGLGAYRIAGRLRRLLVLRLQRRRFARPHRPELPIQHQAGASAEDADDVSHPADEGSG
ncbi:hypothetical protein BO1005MUT1_320135 [Hyphomicrobiales bacterium]|nr:hypothetical protein BO1005MUT1_320135 [Hyphomicrobiales bacterium]